MYKKDFFSIIIPCYNNGEFAREAIKTVVSQTYLNWELLVVDDCSTDGTLEILESVASKDPRIKVIKLNVNQGAGGARNRAIESAQGQFIAFLDADDIWFSEKLDKQLQAFQKKRVAICFTSYGLIDEGGGAISGGVKASSTLGLIDYMKTTQIGMSTAVVNRDVVGDFRINLARTRQDTLLWINILSQEYIAVGVEEILVNYRVRNGQISKNKIKMLIRTFQVYWQVKKIPPVRRLYLYVLYIINAILKRV